MSKVRSNALFAGVLMLAVFPLLSQTRQAKPSFEVISVKPSPPQTGPIRVGGGVRGDRFVMTFSTLRMILQQAYLRGDNTPLSGQLQIIGGPSWMESDRYDIEAKADCNGKAISREELQLMVQSLLEERFQLKAHLEMRDLQIYHLVVAKDGPKLKRSEDQTPPPFAVQTVPPLPCSGVPAPNLPALPPPPPPPPPPGQGGAPPDLRALPRGVMFVQSSPTGLTVQGAATPVANMVSMLQQVLGRTIVDKTDIKGLYDFRLTFSPEGLSALSGRGGPPLPSINAGPNPGLPTTAADPLPSLFTAVQELGLRLESTKAPMEVLVIESVQKPTEN